MRTKKSFLNLLVGMGGQFLSIFLAFLGRIIFAHYLSQEYLGVNGLFTNIIGILSLAELGIGNAMVYSLYKPLAENDRQSICHLMNLYKTLYRGVAVLVLGLGIVLLPFLKYLIKDYSDIDNLTVIYLMYLADSVCSYLFSYKYSVLLADQKAYVKVIYEQAIHVAQIILQIIILILSQNFILYLSIQFVGSIGLNIFVAKKVDKEYPYLNQNDSLPPKEETKEICKNILAMSMHKFGAVFVQGTDNLLMSSFVGLKSVGIYSNYKLVITNINSFLVRIYNALIASVGNLSVSEGSEKIYNIYRTLDFMLYWIYGFISVGLVVEFNPFIELFFGKSYLFPLYVVIILVIDFYITGLRQVTLLFREAMGLFWHDRYKAVAEVIINLIASIVLVNKYGVVGIFIGTIISNLTTCFWIEPYIFMKYGIRKNYKKKWMLYYIHYFIRVTVVLLAGWTSFFICNKIAANNFEGLLLRGIICTIIFNCFFVAFFFRSFEFKEIRRRGKDFMKNFRMQNFS